MSQDLKLFSPVKLGPYDLPHRIVMAPLTRMRAGDGWVPTDLNVEYYAQRASAAFVLAEASQVAPEGMGYHSTPGIHSPEQIEGWRRVTEAVHARGGRIFLQLWHSGRISHPLLQPDGGQPIGPSAVPADGLAFTLDGPRPCAEPRALETDEIPEIVDQFGKGARNAMDAGFDGVELHGANGYIIDQFLQDGANHRTDDYGGSIENRSRFLFDVVRAVTEIWGRDRVGVRLSPCGTYNGIFDSDPQSLFRHVASQLSRYGIGYLHIIEPRIAGVETVDRAPEGLGVDELRPYFPGTMITAGAYNRESAESVLRAGNADLVAFGRLFLANPDLPARFAAGSPLNPYDRDTFYGGDARGYTDYPLLAVEPF
ncbi:alkene reductase [Actinomycetospora sp. OC33-EN08]|uniref:Alkene reductase n=1 Tax=Actinomycetospora aurantiaca TaxID=3129233 RepID=A0ABU8MT40_9PSEU